MKTRIGQFLKRLYRDTSAGAFVYFGAVLPAMVGFVGLGVDVALWHVAKRETQTMADAAAVSAAQDFIKFNDMNGIDQAGLIGAAANGFDTVTDTITINNPPLDGILAGDPDGIEVIVRVPAVNLFSSMFLKGNQVASRAVVRVVSKPGNACIVGLDQVDPALIIGGSTTVNLDCGAVSNSSQETLGSAACFSATSIVVATTAEGGDCITPADEFQRPLRDPLRNMEGLTPAGCDYNNVRVTGQETTVTIGPDPGVDGYTTPIVICGSLNIQTGETLIMEPGLYIFTGRNAQFRLNGTIMADGVTLYFDETTRKPISIQGGADGFMRAPGLDPEAVDYDPDYPYNGILFFVDPLSEAGTSVGDPNPDSPGGKEHTFLGGADLELEGITYMPTADIKFSGNSGTAGSAIIANAVTFTGNSDFGVINSITIDFLLAVRIVDLVE